ncbi:THAP domain-containing protein 2-like [Ornithodoros turicata]|uniref:THAP domain-containing protein 2-like n=1 Tax=Ornithodoros turicata TaxID=34597 RepID=UPI00313930FB
MPTCCVQRCRSRSLRKEPGVSFHSFPKKPQLRAKWIEALGKDVNWVPPEWSRVCSKHFHPDDFVQTQSLVRLRPCAVPKFFPQHEHAGTTSGAEATVEGTMDIPTEDSTLSHISQVPPVEEVASTSFATPLQTQGRAIETSFELLWDPLTTMEMEVDSCSPSTERLPVELVSQMSQGTSPIPCDSLVDMQAESSSSVMGGAPSVEQVQQESPVLSQEYMEEKEQHVSELLWDPLVSVDTEEAEGPREGTSGSALEEDSSPGSGNHASQVEEETFTSLPGPSTSAQKLWVSSVPCVGAADTQLLALRSHSSFGKSPGSFCLAWCVILGYRAGAYSRICI